MEYRRLDWQELPLKKVISVIGDHRGRTPPKLTAGKYRVFSAKNIKTGRIVAEDTIGYFDDELYAKYVRLELKRGDIIITSEAPFGEIFYWDSDEKAALSQRLFSVRIKDEFCAKFIYYYMTYEEFQSELARRSCGTTVLGLRQPELLKCLIRFPPLPTQRKIAKVLSAYDDLIENNTKRIRILERMAEELYKEWFVRFRFPGHEKAKFVNGLPEGWRESRCGEVIDFDPMTRVDRGRQLTMVPMAALSTKMMSLDASQFTIVENASGSKFRNGDTLLAKITPCLENGKTAYVYGLDEGEVAVGSTEFVVMRGREIGPRLCYCIARSDWFRAIAIGSMSGADGRQRVKVEKLRQAVISLPSNELLEKFESVLSPMFNEVEKLTSQNALLARQRDLLLPRLMSGKLSVES